MVAAASGPFRGCSSKRCTTRSRTWRSLGRATSASSLGLAEEHNLQQLFGPFRG